MIRDLWQFGCEFSKAARDGVGVLLHGLDVPVGVSAAPSPAPPAGPFDTSAVTRRPAEDDPVGDPPSPAGSLSWVDWATPAICDVLAVHQYHREKSGTLICLCDLSVMADMQEWREHVAELMAERLESATLALDPARASRDADARIAQALDVFEQHKK